MTSIKYDEIFSQFLGMVEDNKFWSISQDDTNEILTELLHKSVYASYVYRLFSYISTEDPTQMLIFELYNPVNEIGDKYFVITAIAKWMKYEWFSPQLNSVVNTSQMFAGKEQKMYSQAQHMAELKALTDGAYKEARDFIRDKGYIYNDYLLRRYADGSGNIYKGGAS